MIIVIIYRYMDDQCIKSRKTLRKERQKARHDKLHKIKYGYLINKMPEILRETNIQAWNNYTRVKLYDSYKDTLSIEWFDDIDLMVFEHYVLGNNMKYPEKLKTLQWTFRNNEWCNIKNTNMYSMELCDKTYDTYELPALPNTIENLYIYSVILHPIKVLPSNLTRLEIEYSCLKYLPKLPNTLEILRCSNNELIELPELPDKLTRLWCHLNNLTYLPELPKTLECLVCGPTIRKMPNSIVNLKGNNIKNRIELEKIFTPL